MKGDLRGINVPREYEAGQGWSCVHLSLSHPAHLGSWRKSLQLRPCATHFGCMRVTKLIAPRSGGPGFIGLFITRKSGLTLRQALRALIFDPLGLAKDDIDTFLTPALRERYVDVAARHPVDGSFVSLPFHFETPQYEGDVPEGMSVLADAPACATLPAFAKILQAFLNDTKATPAHEPLLSPEAWAIASADDLEKRGLSVGQHPFVKAADPTLATTREKWAVPKDPASVKDDSLGFTLMQTAKHRFEVRLLPWCLYWRSLLTRLRTDIDGSAAWHARVERPC